MRITISKGWTATERLRVINLLCAHAQTQRRLYGSNPKAEDMIERIELVSSATARVLESNVAGIFEGLGIERVAEGRGNEQPNL
jgi:hypothetical protein